MLKEIIATILLSNSIGTQLTPKKAYLEKVSNIYNLRDSFNWDNLSKFTSTTIKIITFDDSFELPEEERYMKCIDMVRYDNKNYFLESMTFMATASTWNPHITSLSVNLAMYDLYANTTNATIMIEEGDTITDISTLNQKLYFYIRESVLIDEDTSLMFNTLFTKEENIYIKNYSGWYNFNNTITSFSNKACMYGTITMDNKMYYSVSTNETSTTTMQVGIFDPNTTNYTFDYLNLPLSQYKTSPQWYLNVKMTESDYVIWQNSGTFGYVPRNSPNEYTFSDLFFDIADTPIYFIYSIFNWQLFGVNLYIAFVGLISFALVLLLFRRFL